MRKNKDTDLGERKRETKMIKEKINKGRRVRAREKEIREFDI